MVKTLHILYNPHTMDLPFSPSFGVFVAATLAFGFLNGFQDSANSVATMIASRAMSPRRALILNAMSHFIGPFLFGSAVARTIGREVIAEAAATQPVVLAALVGAMGWNLFTYLLGLPSSSSHALIGGLVGAALTGHGSDAILVPGVVKVLLSLLLSPVIGMVAGYLLTRLTFLLARGASPRINFFFRRAQTATATALALSSGTNAVQKTMGIITMGLVAEGLLGDFAVPTWVTVACASAMALGIGFGGYRIIRTLGARFYRVRPVHSFTSQVASATVILGAALLGGPVSTTQVVSTSILGAGSAERVNKIRWGVTGDIAVAWLLTIPASGLAAALVYLLVRRFGF
ncbi:MAG: inorganic phosphate transporter [Anaerolineae bacterium]